jgi:8-oxo-dGTP pyrophosphatase MutT (NUDIX family)
MSLVVRGTVWLVSSGGVVCRIVGGHKEVVLCGRRLHNTWSLPKGTPDSGESLEETALREVQEETGLFVEIQEPLGNINYLFVRKGKQYQKTVHYYLMRHTGGAFDSHDLEFDEVRWFSIQDALVSMSYPNEVEVLQRAVLVLQNLKI